MIRVLVIVAVTGFLVSVVCFSAAVGIAGPDALRDWAWNSDGHWNFWHDHEGWTREGWGDRHHHWDQDGGGAQTTREIAWTGGDSLDVDLPADVKYTQRPGPAKLVVTGPQEAVADVVVEDGHVRFNQDHHRWADLTIVMTAPSVTRFEMDGSGKLAIANYKQDKLVLDLSGDSEIVANGEVKDIDLSISGSANADLGELKAKSAEVNIEGSGDATLAPTDAAKVDISGSGDVTLLTRPPRLESHVSGSGSIRQGEPEAATPSGPKKPDRT